MVARTEDRLRRLSEFTADASHELRGPLAALSSTTSAALHDDSVLAPPTRERLTTIAALAEHELFAIEIDGMLTRIATRFRSLAATKGIALALEPCDRVRLYGNPEQIERIVVRDSGVGNRARASRTHLRALLARR